MSSKHVCIAFFSILCEKNQTSPVDAFLSKLRKMKAAPLFLLFNLKICCMVIHQKIHNSDRNNIGKRLSVSCFIVSFKSVFKLEKKGRKKIGPKL